MAKENKKFNYGLYAVATFAIVTAVLVIITIFTFKSKYIAFDEEKIAVNFTDTVAQRGDGYNAYKYTLSAKSEKYGDFIRINYMYPLIYPGYEVGMDGDAFEKIKKNGFNTDAHKSETTIHDDGTLAGNLADAMYPYYVELINQYGWDDYDSVYTNYFNKLIEVRQQIFGDDYLSDEVMFTAIESNVATYGNSLTGTEQVLAEDEKTVIQEQSTGVYQTLFGDDYKMTASVTGVNSIDDLDAYKASLDPAVLETYGISADDISDAKFANVDVKLENGTTVAQVTVYEVKIGNTWYVDNLSTDTSAIYAIAK